MNIAKRLVRWTALCGIILFSPFLSAPVHAASTPPPPPFKKSFPEAQGWAFACFCGEVTCPEIDPITDYCVVYNARKLRSGARAVIFALKNMVTGREPKFVVGFGLEGSKGATRGQALTDAGTVDLPVCSEPYCYSPATVDQVSALAAGAKLEGRAFFGGSSFGTAYDPAAARDLLQKLITLPQHN